MSAESKQYSEREWLAQVCEKDGPPGRAILTRPWTVMGADGLWSVATNGHRMVGLRGEFGYPVPSPDAAHSLVGILDKPFASAGLLVDLAALRQFVGCDVEDAAPPPDCVTCSNTGVVECDECDGDGGEDCECMDCGNIHTSKCSECDDTGETDCPDCERWKPLPTNHGRIFGHLFNRAIFVTPLRYLPGDTALWYAGEKMGVHRLDGDGWRLLVMPVRDEDLPPVEAPEFAALASLGRAVS